MPESVSRVSSSGVTTEPTSGASKASPAGLASTPTTSASLKKPELHPGIFRRIAQSIKNVYEAIINSFKKIFFWIFPKKLSSREIKFLELKKQRIEFRKAIHFVEQYSTIAVIDTAKKLMSEFDAFLILAQKQNEKDKADGKEEIPEKTQIEIVKEKAKKDPKELIAVLKEYYAKKIEGVTAQIKSEKEALAKKS
ncbi:MAG: hypothetical protein KR126chlam6_00139 [Candidatus Anoxychlamydiales bacterium]|nr:hypothetical protein [Candidatus Anoxychlamydiales bacterium]